MAEVTTVPAYQAGRAVGLGAALAAAGFLLCAIGLAVDPMRTWLSYLTALSFAVSIAVGALVLQMAGHAANARWMSVTRRFTESIAAAFPALAILFIPLLFGADLIYPWLMTQDHLPHHEAEVLHHRASYLNLGAFAVRGLLYFAVWIAAAALLRRWSLRRDRDLLEPTGDPDALLSRERVLSCVLLPAVVLAITFAAFDWMMSINTVWYSTIFGVYVFAGGFVAAIGLVIVLAERARRSPAVAAILTPNHFHALGRLLLAFVVFWAYCAFFQAMLIRIANRPEEVVFYLERIEGGWEVFIYLLILGHFALPFLLLIRRAIKFRPRALALVAGWVVLMHLVDVYWLIVPAHVQGAMVVHWVDLAGFAAIFGSAVAFAAWRQRGALLVAVGDPMLPEGASYRSPL
jgi:hypothetical protein